jgi:hypothetical protein
LLILPLLLEDDIAIYSDSGWCLEDPPPFQDDPQGLRYWLEASQEILELAQDQRILRGQSKEFLVEKMKLK